MRRLLLLLLFSWAGISYAQEIEVFEKKGLRAELNDSLFSHFYAGKEVGYFFEFVRKYDFARFGDSVSFGYSLFIGKEMKPRSVFDTLVDFAKRNAIKIYDVNDTSLFLLVPSRLGRKVVKGIDLIIDYERVKKNNFSKKNYYPVPVIEVIIPIWKVAYTGWDKDMKLYVLSAKSGKYASDIYLYNKKGELPPEWEHGYSRGMAINEKKKEVYYWLVIW